MWRSQPHQLFPVCCLQLTYISHKSHLYDSLFHPSAHDGTLLEDACCPLSFREWITGFCDLVLFSVHVLGFSGKNTVVTWSVVVNEHDLAAKALLCSTTDNFSCYAVSGVPCLDSMEHCVQCVHFSAFSGDAIYAWQFKTHVIFVIFW